MYEIKLLRTGGITSFELTHRLNKEPPSQAYQSLRRPVPPRFCATHPPKMLQPDYFKTMSHLNKNMLCGINSIKLKIWWLHIWCSCPYIPLWVWRNTENSHGFLKAQTALRSTCCYFSSDVKPLSRHTLRAFFSETKFMFLLFPTMCTGRNFVKL